MLFFYMIILALVFLIQFSVAIACLAVGQETELKLAKEGWSRATNETKFDLEKFFSCCAFEDQSDLTDAVTCQKIEACTGKPLDGFEYSCPTCVKAIEGNINSAFNKAGGCGFFFALTEVSQN